MIKNGKRRSTIWTFNRNMICKICSDIKSLSTFQTSYFMSHSNTRYAALQVAKRELNNIITLIATGNKRKKTLLPYYVNTLKLDKLIRFVFI